MQPTLNRKTLAMLIDSTKNCGLVLNNFKSNHRFNHRFLPVYRSQFLNVNHELDTSSIENNNPPTGEPKADETPAAAPADIKFRRSSGFRNRLK